MTKRRKRNKKQTNDPVVDDLKSKRSLSGEILRIPAHILYAIVGLITGTILGIVSFFVFPVLIPVYMIKERLAN